MSNHILHWLGESSLLFVVLLSASLAGLVSEKVGVVNIAINGIMIIGGLIFSIFGKITNNMSNPWYYQLFILLLTCVITGAFALLHAIATVTFKANHIVSGMAINILASGIGLFFVSIPSFSTGNVIHNNFNIIKIDQNNIFNIYLFIIIIVAVVLFGFFTFTRCGMNYKAVGENQHAAHALGINVKKIRYISIFISGVLAGFAGCVFTLLNSSIFSGNVSGMGYTSLAIMICAQWKVEFSLLISLFFSLLLSFTDVNWNISALSNSKNLLKTLPYILTIILMVIISKNSKIPKSLGEIFNSEN